MRRCVLPLSPPPLPSSPSSSSERDTISCSCQAYLKDARRAAQLVYMLQKEAANYAAAAACCVVLARFMKAAFTQERRRCLHDDTRCCCVAYVLPFVCSKKCSQSHISDRPTRFPNVVIVRFMKTSHLLGAFATQVPENLTQVQK